MPATNLPKQIPNKEFKAFAKEALAQKGFFKTLFYSFLLLTALAFFVSLGYGLALVFLDGKMTYLVQLFAGLLFAFTLMILLHELLHGLAYKLVGAKKVYFGAILSQFIFYAGSNNEKFNGVQFRFIALVPFAVISALCFCALLFFPDYFLGILTVLFIHTLACGGDFAVVNFMQQYDLRRFHTHDSREKATTYFYLEDTVHYAN